MVPAFSTHPRARRCRTPPFSRRRLICARVGEGERTGTPSRGVMGGAGWLEDYGSASRARGGSRRGLPPFSWKETPSDGLAVWALCRPPELESSASVITKWLPITWGLRVTEAGAAWGPIDLMMPFLVSLGRGWMGLSAWPERQHPLSGSNLWASCCCRRQGVQSWSLPHFALFGQLLNLQGNEITIDWLKDIFEGCWWFSQ